jgi:hypothetical protein
VSLPKITKDKIDPGDVMVGHHLLIAPALLLEKKLTLNEGSFLDFCTMVNALTLHNRLITLRSTLPPSLEDSKLYRYLIKKNILYEFDVDYEYDPYKSIYDPNFKFFDEQDRKQISYLLFGREVSDKERVNRDEIFAVATGSIYHDEYVNNLDLDEFSIVNPELTSQYETFITEVINSTMEDRRGRVSKAVPLSSDPLPVPEKLSSISSVQKERISDFHEMLRLHRLRTAEYWVTAGKLNIPFLPDFMRIPAVAGYQGLLRYAIRYIIQNIFDKIALEEFLATDKLLSSIEIPIPDGVSNFLNKYRSTGSMEESFNYMRETFANYKNQIIQWEDQVYNIRGVSRMEKLEVLKEIKSTMSSSLQQIGIDFTEIGASLIDNILLESLSGHMPVVPGSQPILKLAVDYFKASVAKKKIWYFLWGRNEAANIENQHEMLKYAFGASLDETQINRFLQLTNSLYMLSKRPKVVTLSSTYMENIQPSNIPIIEKEPIDIVKERLAKGEITIDNFDAIRKRLEA